jgi:hypothetical protein
VQLGVIKVTILPLVPLKLAMALFEADVTIDVRTTRNGISKTDTVAKCTQVVHVFCFFGGL